MEKIKRPLEKIKQNWKEIIKWFLISWVIVLIFIPFSKYDVKAPWTATANEEEEKEGFLITSIISVIFAPFFEEIFFRGPILWIKNRETDKLLGISLFSILINGWIIFPLLKEGSYLLWGVGAFLVLGILGVIFSYKFSKISFPLILAVSLIGWSFLHCNTLIITGKRFLEGAIFTKITLKTNSLICSIFLHFIFNLSVFLLALFVLFL